MKLSDIIKSKRKELGLSQRDLASRIGMNYSYIAKIENDKAIKPSVIVLIKLSNFFKIDLYKLLEVSEYSKEEIILLTGRINIFRKNINKIDSLKNYIIKTEIGDNLDIAKILNDYKNEKNSLEETINLIHLCQPEYDNNSSYYPTKDKIYKIQDL